MIKLKNNNVGIATIHAGMIEQMVSQPFNGFVQSLGSVFFLLTLLVFISLCRSTMNRSVVQLGCFCDRTYYNIVAL